jgi:hypothetical protein
VRSTILMTLTLASAVSVAVGCGDDETTAGPTCFDYSGYTAGAPVSFQNDVLPIFRGSCGFSSCHNDQTGPTDRPYYGKNINDGDMTACDIAVIFEQAVGEVSVKATGMKIIEPGKPEASFLMYKLDGTLECDAIQGCSGEGSCGTTMPQGSDKLESDRLETIRSWIKQGAINDAGECVAP